MSTEKLYTATATATGGRDGRTTTSDKSLDLSLSTPKTMGGAGVIGATNPEQLFAAGYAACFDNALLLIASQENQPIVGSSVDADVTLGKDGENYDISVDLRVNIPGMEQAQAEELVAKAHQLCPYSRATRGNIAVSLTTTTHA
jgi:Ohr subfamily peroxiredoxin